MKKIKLKIFKFNVTKYKIFKNKFKDLNIALHINYIPSRENLSLLNLHSLTGKLIIVEEDRVQSACYEVLD